MNVLKTIEALRETLLTNLYANNSIGLVTHTNPDGDGLCCCLAIKELLTKTASTDSLSAPVKVDIILETEPPQTFDFIEAKDRTICYSDNLSYPLLIVLDCQSPERLGICAPLISKAEKIIVVDHHELSPSETAINGEKYEDSEHNASLHFIYNNPSFVSAGAILHRALSNEFKSLPSPAKEYCATNLYLTIINDTNSFTNSNTTAEVFTICSELSALNIKPHEIAKYFYSSKPPAFFRFLGQSLATIKTYDDDAILLFHCTIKMLNDNNLPHNEASNMTDYVKNVSHNTKVIVFFREIKENHYRLSLRSTSININKIAVQYGGGGHILASGCEIEGTLQEIEQKILHQIRQEIVSFSAH